MDIQRRLRAVRQQVWRWGVSSAVCLTGLVLLSGCAGFASLAETLNERQVQSCIRWQGFAGGGWPGVPQVQVQGMTATGGVTLAQCIGPSSP